MEIWEDIHVPLGWHLALEGFLTAMYWKHIPTMKLQAQLQKPATAMAAGRGPWLNSSATINQGMGPGPTSKKMTKRKIATMLT